MEAQESWSHHGSFEQKCWAQ